jgi:Replication-relaxation
MKAATPSLSERPGMILSDRSDDVEHLSPMGYLVLKALAEYRYLTTNQMLDLGIAKDRGYLGKVLADLQSAGKDDGLRRRRPKEVGALDFGVKVGRGRLPRMYYLTKRGAFRLEDVEYESAPVPYPPRVVQFSPDYEHRVSTVDFHIALNMWAEKSDQNLRWFRRYYDWWPANKKRRQHPVTQISLEHKNIVPDALFMLDDKSGAERLFAFEMANGMDTGRVVDQMREYCRGLDQGKINAAFNYGTKAIRILYVFEHQRLLELVQAKAVQDRWLQQYAAHFFLKTTDDISQSEFVTVWKKLDAGSSSVRLF